MYLCERCEFLYNMRYCLLLVALHFALTSSVQDLPQTTPSPCLCADMSACHHIVSGYMTSEDTCSGLTVISNSKSETEVNCNGRLLDCGKLPQLSYAKGRVLSKLTVANCEVRSLSCVLTALNASDVSTLNYSVSTTLTADKLTGFNMVDNLYLNGRSNTTNTIPVEALRSLPNLKSLRIENFGLTSLPPNTFNNIVPNLRVLDVNNNNLTTIQADAFNGLKHLEKLELYKNHIEEIEANAFRGLKSLEEIFLNKNSVDVLPSGVFSEAPLRELRLARNQGALRLQTGALSGMIHLEKVILQSDSLTLEPASLSHLPALMYAIIQRSAVERLPADLFYNTTALFELNFSRNKLRSLPPTVFVSLSKLRILHLSHNLLDRVDRTVFEPLHNLRELYLDGNLIQVLNENTLDSLHSLTTVNMSCNLISLVEEHVFPIVLVSLDLSANKLEWCPLLEGLIAPKMSSPLRNLTNLRKLNLSTNSIQDVCSDWIDDMLQLQTLDLSYNNITILKNSDINFVNHNIKVNLQDNPITTIKDLIHSSFEQSILLGRNSFHCDCVLYDFLQQTANSLGQAACDSPKSLKGCNLDSIAHGGNCGSKKVSLSDLTCPVDAPKVCKCIRRPAKQRIECDCEQLPNDLPIPSDMDSINHMELKLHSLQNSSLPNFVTMLNLSGLSLNMVPELPTHVKFVDLSDNNLISVPLEFLQRNITMKLGKNPLECDCLNSKDIENLQTFQTKIEDYNILTCKKLGEVIFVNGLNVATLCYHVYVIAGVVFGVILALSTPICYKYNLHIRLWLVKLGCTCFVSDKVCVEDRKKKNDIFLSFVHQDETWVKETLLPKLDARYKVCVHTRDWIVGESILDQIYASVADSRRTVIVLSNAYIQSGTWAQEEFRAAYLQTTKDKHPRCVVILLEDVNLDKAPKHIQLAVKLNTYIEWEDILFWERLYDAIPKRMTVKHVRRRWLTEKAWRILSGGRSADAVHEEMGLMVPVVKSPPQA